MKKFQYFLPAIDSEIHHCSSRIECPAFIQISGQKLNDNEQYLVVKRMVLEHNHPCQSGHFHFYPQIQFAVNADENLVMLDLVGYSATEF